MPLRHNGWRLRRSTLIPVLVGVVVGCEKDPCAKPGDAPTIVALDGQAPHAPLDVDTVLPIQWGMQGGFHVFLSAEVTHLHPGSADLQTGLANEDLPTVLWEVRAPDGLLSTESPRRVLAEPADVGYFLGTQLVVLRYYETVPTGTFDPDAREAELEQSPIEVSVTVEDQCGVQVGTENTIGVEFYEPLF